MREATQLPAAAIGDIYLSLLLPTRGRPTYKPSVVLIYGPVFLGAAQLESSVSFSGSKGRSQADLGADTGSVQTTAVE